MNKSEAFVSSHPHSSQDDFRTPYFVFDWLNFQFGPIQYDGACEDGVNNLAQSLRLEDDWPTAATVYSNPPWDAESIEKWILKGIQLRSSGGTHIMLIPNKLCQCFISKYVSDFDRLIFIGGRIDFSGPYSCSGGASRSGSVIIIQSHYWSLQGVSSESILLRDIKRRFS